jgi:glucose-1-phosphate thymidylyltransferase
MAGYGTRMRPHTWSKAKPLVAVAGRTVLDYVLEQFKTLPKNTKKEYIFIVGSYQLEQVSQYMTDNYPDLTCHFVVQEEMLGQSHALYQAKDYLINSPVLMTFSDTLIETDLGILADPDFQAAAWVRPVPDPRRFGVAVTNQAGWVTKLVEKPESMENNLVVVGFYYFENGSDLISAIEEQQERNLTLKGEFFLADAVNIMLEKGIKMRTQKVQAWLDAGLPDAVLETNRYLLDHGHDNGAVYQANGVTILPPVFIHETAEIKSSVIGPHASIGAHCVIEDAIIRDSVLDSETEVKAVIVKGTLLGKKVQVTGKAQQLNLGDNASIKA